MAKWWDFRKQPQPVVEKRDVNGDVLLSALVSIDEIDNGMAMMIPAFAGAVNLISDTVASLPIRLFKKSGDRTEPVDNDVRVRLLNTDTGDTLNSFEWKRSMITDFLVSGEGYSYINKTRNKVKSLNYVSSDKVSVVSSPNPIFKQNDFLVYGARYKDFEFVRLLRKSKNGATGYGVVEENNKVLSVAYYTMIFEEMLVKSGGNKKGFLKAQKRLSPDAMTQLKTAWKNLFQTNTENVIILNDGLEFQESVMSTVEMQLNQNKITNAKEIRDIFNIPNDLKDEESYETFVKLTILPILKAFETALNKDLLLASEKDAFCFEFDTNDLLKGDIEKRFKAYEIGVKNGILQIDEVRHIENFEPIGLDFIKLGLGEVLYNPKTKEIYTPNTNAIVKMGEEIEVKEPANGDSPNADSKPAEKGVKKDESGNQE